ncbi:molybdenum cofactor guanylyltransferase [Parapedobacter sp. 10938]|uniref:molybdenum cofactor guanylyltransferase n=1 Tax=Parapedobacter flavus TaxID=3110225 RepID=UPI002DBEF529|nr:molybdenum cofactor guanylyltransferase [Parapedobacter sp. 10938]MEC3878225.1 molybdenum cofactor guanylyltransferase [Parapedobacter sp. 10938]
MRNLIGLVLCGGKSSRMGTDKGTLVRDGCTWAEHMRAKLRQLDLKTYVSINPLQFEKYGQFFSSTAMIPDAVDVKGPLGGLLSAHLRFPKKNVLVVPCDMVDLDVSLLQRLLDIRRQIVQADVYLYGHAEFTEPLCAIYTASGLRKLFVSYNEGNLTDFSVKRATQSLSVVYLPIPEHTDGFRNYNTPECVAEWQEADCMDKGVSVVYPEL